MFRFDFQDVINDEEPEIQQHDAEQNIKHPPETGSVEECSKNDAFREYSLEELISSLPPEISYSPIVVPIPSTGSAITLTRRDLYDARLQVISREEGEPALSQESAEEEEDLVGFVEAPSDLIPGVYEGGLKTWECSLDLIAYMKERRMDSSWLDGKRVLELGCGTALPTIYLLSQLFDTPSESTHDTRVFHLQDYNASVLKLVTLPNIILAWYFSESSKIYRARQTTDDIPSKFEPGDLILDEGLLSAFKTSLSAAKISLRFFSGSWAQFCLEPVDTSAYHLVLTSETIYQSSSLPSLLNTLQRVAPSTVHIEKQMQNLSVQPPPNQLLDASGPSSFPSPLILVAAKVLYFGVGGGIDEFVNAVRARKGYVRTVWEMRTGVGRRVLRVSFPS